MDKELFHKLIVSVLDSTSPGYGFVNDFSETLLSFPGNLTNINHVVQLWNLVFPEGKTHELTYFSSTKLNMAGVNRGALMDCAGPVTPRSDLSGLIDSLFVWANNFIAIPMSNHSSFSTSVELKGVLLLLSSSSDPIMLDDEQVSTLYAVLSAKKPIIEEANCVRESMGQFRLVSDKFLSISEKWNSTLSALQCLSIDSLEGVDSGVCYSSFWKINKKELVEQEPILKQMERSFGPYVIPNDSITSIPPESNDYLRIYANRLVDNGKCDYSLTQLSQENETLVDSFLASASPFEVDTISLIVVPVEIKTPPLKSVDICCIYVKDILFTPFISRAFISQFQKEIVANLSFINEELQGRLSMELMFCLSHDYTYTEFCRRISQVVSKYNSVEETLIYTLDAAGNLCLTSKEDINIPSTFLNKTVKIGARSCYLPDSYSTDSDFRQFLSSLAIVDDKSLMSQIITYQPLEKKTNGVRNCLAMAIHNPGATEVSGILLLINKVHSTDTPEQKVYDNITVDNVIIIYLCSTILYLFDRWNKDASRKNYLLKKLRHEIPHCTRGINDKVNVIRKRIADRGVVDGEINQSLLSLLLNNNRINTLASFFAAVDYEDKRFAEKAKKIDLIEELESNLPLFREEAFAKGVDVIIEKEGGLESLILQVSDFFLLAIINIVNNAIRYCSRGTVIIISVSSSKITVSDIGIPILPGEKELIFDDGFRGSNAKERDAQGIGYGLHISRRVLRAHFADIDVDSTSISDENVVLERIISNYIKSLSQVDRYKYIHRDTIPAEETVLNKLLNRISQRQEIATFSKYYNNHVSMIKAWLERDLSMGGPSFIDMDELWFLEPIALVSFTIQLSNVKKYEEDIIIG